MNKTITALPEIKLVGITTRTNNKEAMADDPNINKIASTVEKYMQNQIANKISNRKNPGTTFCVYTNYESDEHGQYTYFIGEEVTSFESLDQGFEMLTIPAQNYAKLISNPGPMPAVCIDMWQNIWIMNAADLGGQRAYIADFEVYDERSRDPKRTVLDIYIGIK